MTGPIPYMSCGITRVCPRCGQRFLSMRSWLEASDPAGAECAFEDAPALSNGTPVRHAIKKPIRTHRDCGGQCYSEGSVNVEIMWPWRRAVGE